MWYVLCAVLLASAVYGESESSRPIVATVEGQVEGLTSTSADGNVFYSFKGLPYAQPPTGELRFQPPRRHLPWANILDASEHGSQCAQFDFRKNATRVGSEDCLFANIYTPWLPGKADSPRRGLPVMVYIHGGGFFFGDGDAETHGPEYLMDEDVVVVTFNYRLGVFGFLTTHDAAAPGNFGLLDQVLLLQWVQDNIAAFGGDPQQVTIFGVSAGGASVSLLVLSPLGKGLFHHAISESGAAIASFAASGKKSDLAKEFAEFLNCTTDDPAMMVDCIRKAPEEDIMDGSLTLRAFMNAFQPRVDSEAEVPFLPKDPRVLLETGEFNLVPWMNGITEEEGYAFVPLIMTNRKLTNGFLAGAPQAWAGLSQLAPPFTLDCGADMTKELAKIIDFYSSDGNFSVATIARVLSDRIFVSSTSEEIRLASAHAPVYKYIMDHRGEGRLRLTELERLPLPDLGTTHGEELLYIFGTNKRPLAEPGTPEHTMIRFMTTLWTSFARTGRPSSDVLPMPDWPIFTEDSQRHMRLNSQPEIGERLFEERVNFWQTVPINEPWRHAVQTECETEKAAQTETGGYSEEASSSGTAGAPPPASHTSTSGSDCLETSGHPCPAMELLL
ncbi:carboxylesterase 1E-like [Amphibalanus amphitrite]|uniref:carboxylesterase 1E-like n=1 Tax=Amphibalanus amphitrite TaxID=1232801 RepID=UPI001C92901E|nr:carboxylesterase 1E-like [Amphibalanus amphitrite]